MDWVRDKWDGAREGGGGEMGWMDNKGECEAGDQTEQTGKRKDGRQR